MLMRAQTLEHRVYQQASNDIGGYFLTAYGDVGGLFHAADAVSGLGALAGVFAHVQAREMLRSGALPNTGSALVEVRTKDGELYYFGDAINACVMEGDEKRPSFWNIAAGAANDPEIGAKISTSEIAAYTASSLGGPNFGIPRIDPRYQLTERPIDAVRRHIGVLSRRLTELSLPPDQLMWAFGAAAQGLATFAAGEHADVRVNVALPRAQAVRLYMESAIPMSKLDLNKIAAGGA